MCRGQPSNYLKHLKTYNMSKKKTVLIPGSGHASLAGVRACFSGNETIKRIGWEAEKIFNSNHAGVISRSKARQDFRVLVAQAIVDELISYVPKSRQKELIHNLGFYTEAECARLMCCSRQYVNKIHNVMQEKIFFAGKWWLKPIPLSEKNLL